uniref:AGAL n=1 Tax=Arundo donax TaxID=35708 RepID=A0A0A8YGF3_ARUDO
MVWRFGPGRSVTTGGPWFSGTGRATRQPSPRNGQTSGSIQT